MFVLVIVCIYYFPIFLNFLVRQSHANFRRQFKNKAPYVITIRMHETAQTSIIQNVCVLERG